MARSRLLATGLAAAVVLGCANAPARAQCRLCSEPTTEVQRKHEGAPIRLQVETTLDFDRLVLLGGGDGVATLLPTGERSATGSIAALSAGAMVGSVTVRGDPGRAVWIELPARIELYTLSGDSIVIDRIETDLPALPKLDSAGNLSFRFGGRLQISGDSEGEYRGDVPILVEYL